MGRKSLPTDDSGDVEYFSKIARQSWRKLCGQQLKGIDQQSLSEIVRSQA